MLGLLLPFGFNIIMWFLKRAGASAETQKKMLAMIESAQNDGIISKRNKDELKSQKEEIEAEINKAK